MTLRGTNEFRFNHATMREIVAHYLVTKMLDPEQVVEVESITAVHGYGGGPPSEFVVTVRTPEPAPEEKKP